MNNEKIQSNNQIEFREIFYNEFFKDYCLNFFFPFEEVTFYTEVIQEFQLMYLFLLNFFYIRMFSLKTLLLALICYIVFIKNKYSKYTVLNKINLFKEIFIMLTNTKFHSSKILEFKKRNKSFKQTTPNFLFLVGLSFLNKFFSNEISSFNFIFYVLEYTYLLLLIYIMVTCSKIILLLKPPTASKDSPTNKADTYTSRTNTKKNSFKKSYFAPRNDFFSEIQERRIFKIATNINTHIANIDFKISILAVKYLSNYLENIHLIVTLLFLIYFPNLFTFKLFFNYSFNQVLISYYLLYSNLLEIKNWTFKKNKLEIKISHLADKHSAMKEVCNKLPVCTLIKTVDNFYLESISNSSKFNYINIKNQNVHAMKLNNYILNLKLSPKYNKYFPDIRKLAGKSIMQILTDYKQVIISKSKEGNICLGNYEVRRYISILKNQKYNLDLEEFNYNSCYSDDSCDEKAPYPIIYEISCKAIRLNKGNNSNNVNNGEHSFSTIVDNNKKVLFKHTLNTISLNEYEGYELYVYLIDVSYLIYSQRETIESNYQNIVMAKLAHEMKTPSIGIDFLIDSLRDFFNQLRKIHTREIKMVIEENIEKEKEKQNIRNSIISLSHFKSSDNGSIKLDTSLKNNSSFVDHQIGVRRLIEEDINKILVKIQVLNDMTNNSIKEIDDLIKKPYNCKISKEEVSLFELCSWTYCCLNLLIEIHSKKNILTPMLDCDPSFIPCLVNIDYNRMKIFIYEILKNAVNYSTSGIIRIQVGLKKDEKKNSNIVKDSFGNVIREEDTMLSKGSSYFEENKSTRNAYQNSRANKVNVIRLKSSNKVTNFLFDSSLNRKSEDFQCFKKINNKSLSSIDVNKRNNKKVYRNKFKSHPLQLNRKASNSNSVNNKCYNKVNNLFTNNDFDCSKQNVYNENQIYFKISDEGVGFSSDQMDKIKNQHEKINYLYKHKDRIKNMKFNISKIDDSIDNTYLSNTEGKDSVSKSENSRYKIVNQSSLITKQPSAHLMLNKHSSDFLNQTKKSFNKTDQNDEDDFSIEKFNKYEEEIFEVTKNFSKEGKLSLGLNIIKAYSVILELDLKISSQRYKGTTFIFNLLYKTKKTENSTFFKFKSKVLNRIFTANTSSLNLNTTEVNIPEKILDFKTNNLSLFINRPIPFKKISKLKMIDKKMNTIMKYNLDYTIPFKSSFSNQEYKRSATLDLQRNNSDIKEKASHVSNDNIRLINKNDSTRSIGLEKNYDPDTYKFLNILKKNSNISCKKVKYSYEEEEILSAKDNYSPRSKDNYINIHKVEGSLKSDDSKSTIPMIEMSNNFVIKNNISNFSLFKSDNNNNNHKKCSTNKKVEFNNNVSFMNDDKVNNSNKNNVTNNTNSLSRNPHEDTTSFDNNALDELSGNITKAMTGNKKKEETKEYKFSESHIENKRHYFNEIYGNLVLQNNQSENLLNTYPNKISKNGDINDRIAIISSHQIERYHIIKKFYNLSTELNIAFSIKISRNNLNLMGRFASRNSKISQFSFNQNKFDFNSPSSNINNKSESKLSSTQKGTLKLKILNSLETENLIGESEVSNYAFLSKYSGISNTPTKLEKRSGGYSEFIKNECTHKKNSLSVGNKKSLSTNKRFSVNYLKPKNLLLEATSNLDTIKENDNIGEKDNSEIKIIPHFSNKNSDKSSNNESIEQATYSQLTHSNTIFFNANSCLSELNPNFERAILVVDDDYFCRKSLKTLIENILKHKKTQFKYVVYKVADGLDTINLLISNSNGNQESSLIKLIISDQNMAIINGSESFSMLNKLEKLGKVDNSIPKVILTAIQEESALKNIKANSGADEVITKPANKKKIEAILNKYIV